MVIASHFESCNMCAINLNECYTRIVITNRDLFSR